MDSLKPYKHVFVPLIIFLICGYGLHFLSTKENQRSRKLSDEVKELQEMIKLNSSLTKEKKTMEMIDSTLLREDADMFLNRVLRYASESGLGVQSSRKDAEKSSRRRKKGEPEIAYVKDYSVSMDFESSYDSLVKFTNIIDKTKEYIYIDSLIIKRISPKEDSGRAFKTVSVSASVKAKAHGEQ